MQVGGRWIVGGVVVAHDEEQHNHHQYDTDACWPNAFDVILLKDGAHDAKEQQKHSDEKDNDEIPHIKQVVEILHRLHNDFTRSSHSIAIADECADEEGQEEDKEQHRVDDKLRTYTSCLLYTSDAADE